MTGRGISGSELAGSSFGINHLGLIAAHLGTAFSAGGTFVDTNYCNTPGTANNLNPCPPRLSGNPWVFDIIITVLIVQVAVAVFSLAKWFQKPGGLSADPTTIVGVAAVMGHPEIENLFASFPGDMSKQQLKGALKEHEFKLGNFLAENGSTKYGIIPAPLTEEEKGKRNKQGLQGLLRKLGIRLSRKKQKKRSWLSNWKNSQLLIDFLFGVLLLALLGLVLAALTTVDHPQTLFPPSITANGTGMKIGFALLGVLISLYWGRLFQGPEKL
ncbi:hypothetical protein N0V88_006596 [Collariella sp. IMI 366227]|nr:hypothetical protein N0V88_006596 [Collariella sp. IMI 366227]